jgi:hypothetical protein
VSKYDRPNGQQLELAQNNNTAAAAAPDWPAAEHMVEQALAFSEAPLWQVYMKATGALYQWEGRGTPSMFCILEGSANMRAASAGPGRQLTSEPPMQLWGASAQSRSVRMQPNESHSSTST